MSAVLLQLSKCADTSDAKLLDLRFRALLGSEAWEGLPAEVRRRFSKRLSGARAAIYRGLVVDMRMSQCGWLLAQLCRLFGAPLPLNPKAGGGALVSVSEDRGGGGQCWTRIYARPDRFPQVIHSAKRFAGPTGLEEYLGCGLGMALLVQPLSDGIAFVSDHYFFQLGRRRVRLPALLAPGVTRVTHRQVAGSSFLFGLEVVHPLAGLLVRQEILFDDVD
ncbi:MAG TPA: DUF4166 domain-containing protein [Sphingomicrobium sp.]|nr:DUF4166 domain-containing protein [Sphingomicrobium sp.]